MVARERIPDRGDIVIIDFEPQAGKEIRKRRPALVISPQLYNGRSGLALMCPITSSLKGYPFEVVLPPGLAASGTVLADQLRSLDWRARRADIKGRVPALVVADVLAKIVVLLD